MPTIKEEQFYCQLADNEQEPTLYFFLEKFNSSSQKSTNKNPKEFFFLEKFNSSSQKSTNKNPKEFKIIV